MKDKQTVRLLEYLTEHKTIQPLEAWVKLGIYRLGARIFNLKQGGVNITSKIITVENQHGEKYRVAQYTLEQDIEK